MQTLQSTKTFVFGHYQNWINNQVSATPASI